jgi:hypothetical protein
MSNTQKQPALVGQVEPTGRPALQTGHYFKLERGQWTKDGNWPPTFCQASGRTYIGCLTLEQRIELDALIDGYLKGLGA